MSAREYTLNVRLTVDDEWVEDVIEMAGYGCNYWLERGVVDTERRTYTVTPFDPDSGNREPVKRLTYGGIVRAAQRLLTGEAVGLSDENVGRVFRAVIDGDVDAEMADWIIQSAVHKEVLYG